ncbi:MAG: hypothetical protein APR55_05955 [Methanolinea sp. SDB]|nr:MAG: hypothetical protein APR55_05955 [Methanolinea sp. SDB]
MEKNPQIIRLSGRIDATTAPGMEKELFSGIEEGTRAMIIDLEAVDYMSSAGLRVLLSALKKMKSVGGEVRLSSLQPHVREVFEMTGFSRLFTICADIDDAQTSF